MGIAPPRMTLDQFLVWEEDQPDRHEFYRGETYAMVGGTARHNRVILNLASRLGDHLDGSSLREYALVDPATRQVEVFTKAEAGAWRFTDQSGAEALTLASIALELPVAAVFKGVEASGAA